MWQLTEILARRAPPVLRDLPAPLVRMECQATLATTDFLVIEEALATLWVDRQPKQVINKNYLIFLVVVML